MRTVFIGAHEEPNGVNSYTYNLALELNRRGYESSVLSFGSCNKETDYKGVKIKQYKTPGGTMSSIPVLYIKSLPYLIKHRHEIDMVMYQTVIFSVIPSLIVRMFGMKSSCIIHSLAEDSPKHSNLMKQILKAAMKLSLTFSKNIITVSHTKAQEVYDRYHKKCKVLCCGVYFPEETEPISDILDRNGIKSGKYFLSIGRIDPIKNLEVLIDAFKAHQPKGYQLVIGGDVDHAYGRTVVARAEGNKDIIFPGTVYGESKALLLKHCSAYCLVSSSEGLPIALLEGMSYGKVPIVTRIPSIQEVLANNEIGLWSDVKDVNQVCENMKKVEEQFDKYHKHGNVALQIVKEKYTWPQICTQYLSMVKNF